MDIASIYTLCPRSLAWCWLHDGTTSRPPPANRLDIPLVHGVPLGGGWTYLYYAFGYINPTTFEIVDEQDPFTQSLHREFTDLKCKANGPSVRCYPVSTNFPG